MERETEAPLEPLCQAYSLCLVPLFGGFGEEDKGATPVFSHTVAFWQLLLSAFSRAAVLANGRNLVAFGHPAFSHAAVLAYGCILAAFVLSAFLHAAVLS